jgi:alkaline phosphatase D
VPDHLAGLLITRRQVLVGTAAAALVTLTGCRDGGDGDPEAGTTTTNPPPDLAGDPFTLGVASGDPRPDSVILWTRLAPDPLALDGLGGMPDQDVDVTWEVAADDAFADLLATGVVVASPEHAHAIHVDAAGLDAGAVVHYRFRVGEHTSPVGRTRTLPSGSPDRFGLAVVNCQWFETGRYAAYRHLVAEDSEVDLVLHLGDYIYEYPGAGEGERATLPTHQLETLADYRLRYASYRMDGHLRAAHARYPFVLTWDDHEVSNNYSGAEIPELPGDTEALAERKAAAYLAWWEHLPVRIPPPTGPELLVRQHLDVGDLARIYLLDQRQYSDVPPCRGAATATDDYGDCAERTDDRTILGEAQEDWFGETSAASEARWNLVGNPVVLAGIDGGSPSDGAAFYLDTWDGYPTARQRFIDQLAAVANPVVLTGDYHAGMLLDVHERPFEVDSAVVAPELMAPPISSPLFPADVSPRTPHLREQLNGHGYLKVDVTPDAVRAWFQVLDDVSDEDSAIATELVVRIDDGSRTAVVEPSA